MKSLFNLLFNVLVAFLIGGTVAFVTGMGAWEISTGIILIGATYNLFAKPERGVACMSLQREVWGDHIQENLYEDEKFLNHFSKPEDGSTVNDSRGMPRIVHISQLGAKGNVVKNRQSVPAQVSKQALTDIVYLLNSFSTDPKLIKWSEEKQLSPQYRNAVMGDDRSNLSSEIAEDMLYSVVTSPSIVAPAYSSSSIVGSTAGVQLLTTGADGTANDPTGTAVRKILTRSDFQRMRSAFVTKKAWSEGRMYALVDADSLVEAFPANDIITATYAQNLTEEERREGVIMKVSGWKIIERGSVLTAATGGAIKVPGEALVNTDDKVSVFWNETKAEHQISGTEFFMEEKKPEYYGDIYSMETFAGGRAVREDYAGIGILKQAK